MENIKKKIIGLHKYNQLKKFESSLSPEEKQMIKDFEEVKISEDKLEYHLKYSAEVRKDYVEPPIPEFTTQQIKKMFQKAWWKKELKPYDVSSVDYIENLKVITYYFAKDPKFFKSPHLVTEFDFGGKIKRSKPSFEKGLLIIGNFGNGKTSVMRAFANSFRGIKGWFFKQHNANSVVDLYEACETGKDKDGFWKLMLRERVSFDDVKTERIANNYGKVNLFKDIIEKRYFQGLFETFILTNYKEGAPESVEMALLEFGEKYGSRAFDRLFEMFNIVKFKGKSFRE